MAKDGYSAPEMELLDDLRNRLLNIGIVGMPYLMEDGSLRITVHMVWLDSRVFPSPNTNFSKEVGSD